jgi:PAS domain S-box-containing protein
MHQSFESAQPDREVGFRLLVESIKDCEIIMLDRAGYILTWNAGVTHLKGYQPQEIVGQHFSCFFPKADLEQGKPALALQIAAAQGRFEQEGWQLRKDGSQFWANIVITVLQEGGQRGFCLMTRDISTQRTAQRQSQRSQNQLRQALQAASIAQVGLQQLKETLEAKLQACASAIKQLTEQLQAGIDDRQFHEATRPYLSAQQETEEELKRTQSFFHSLVENIPVGVFVRDAATLRYLVWNKAEAEIIGYPKEAVLGKNDSDLFPPEEAAFFTTKDQEVLDSGVLDIHEELIETPHRGIRLLYTRKIPILDEAGKPLYLLGITEDITERKRAETALHMQQQFLQSVIDSNPNWIFVKNWNGEFVLVNQSLAAAYGTSPQCLIGKTDADFNPNPAEVAQHLQADRDVMTTLQEQFIPEEPITTAAGEVRWMQTIKKPLFSPNGSVSQVLVVATDITQRKQMEDALRRSEAQLRQQAQDLEQTLRELQQTQTQLVQSEKMSSLGQLVAGVAHEINNPVSFIYGNLTYAKAYTHNLVRLLQLYQQHYPQPVSEIADEAEAIELNFLIEDLPKLLSSMEFGAERIQQIVRSLRNFSRKDEAEKKAVNIHEGIDSTLMILQNRLKASPTHSGIQVIKAYSDLPLVECYVGQLNQVFMNLLTNAIDALEDHQQRTKQPATIRIQTELLETGWVRICIVDNGSGIPEAVQQRLFDPFFTTKPVGKGTGLGLSISYQIITEKHGGSLRCRSTPNQGTEFIIEIPIVQQAASSETKG